MKPVLILVECPTLFSSRQIFDDVIDGMLHVIIPRHIHVDQPQERGTLDPQALCPFATCVQTSGKDVKAEGIQMSG